MDSDPAPAAAAAAAAAAPETPPAHYALYTVVDDAPGSPVFEPRVDTEPPTFDAVNLPCHESAQYRGQPKWPLVCEALSTPVGSPAELLAAMRKYSDSRRGLRAFDTLCSELSEEAVASLFSDLLPFIARLALDLPNAIRCTVPLLLANREASLSLTQYQAAVLLANAFFCTFGPNPLDFQHWFSLSSWLTDDCDGSIAKLFCIFHYFRRIKAQMPNGVVTFHRRVLTTPLLVDWATCKLPLLPVVVTVEGRIEDDAPGMLHADFANMYIGGGVLGHGCVQEEILFVIKPELLVSMLVCQRMRYNEAIFLIGAQRFSDYTGYGWSFGWKGDHPAVPGRDARHRLLSQATAIDALQYSSADDMEQWEKGSVLREMNKALIGFLEPEPQPDTALPPIATGKWGCGAFGGDAHIKTIIQLLSASAAGRSMRFFTFGDDGLAADIKHLLPHLAGKTVADLYHALMKAIPADFDGKMLFHLLSEAFESMSQS